MDRQETPGIAPPASALLRDKRIKAWNMGYLAFIIARGSHLLD
jgi:hypothetical protein